MLESQEWKSLSNKAIVIYVQMRKNAFNNIHGVKIPYSSLEGRMAPQTISNGLKELVASGFIKQVFKGGMYGSPAIYDFVGPFKDPWNLGRTH